MYLLSTQATLDAAAGMSGRLATVEAADIHLSVISAARAKSEISQSKGASVYLRNLRRLVSLVKSHGHLIPVDETVADRWAELLYTDLQVTENGLNVALDDDNRLVVATALVFNLVLLEAPQPYHETLSLSALAL